MDNILEILVPLIFAAIYFFGNMAGKSKEEEDSAPLQPRRRSSGGGDGGDAAERQRKIQEEIRRKIMERRQASEGGRPPVVRVGNERSQPHKQTREVVHQTREVSPPLVAATRETEEDPASAAFSWNVSDNAYNDGEVQAQLRRIEETKRQAEKLKKQAAQSQQATHGSKITKRKSGGYFTGSVRESLQNPRAARVAFIYGEVLGQPISLRKGSSSVPGLN